MNPEHLYEYQARFRYHASAVAFGTRLAAPTVLEARAAVALPSTGGRATESASGYVLDAGFIRFDTAGSEVLGEWIPGPDPSEPAGWRTRAHTWIKGFVVTEQDVEIVRIDDLSVTIMSEHYKEQERREVAFERIQVRHEGFTIHGQCCLPALTPALVEIDKPTFPEVMSAVRARTADPSRIYAASESGGERQMQMMPLANADPTEVTVFGIEPPAPARPAIGGMTLFTPEGKWFRFYFGEYVLSAGRRRFTALRMEFHRSPDSSAVVGEVEVNGSEHP